MSEDDNEAAALQQEPAVDEQPKKAPRKRAKKAKKANGNGKASREPVTLDEWGIREGTARSKAVALYARPEGASLAEVKEAVGSVQYNVLTELKEKGHTITVSGKRGAQRYQLSRGE